MSAVPALSFGALLRHHRLAAGLTQEQLAERAGVSPRAIIALEGGERRRPHRQTIQLLAAALHLAGRDLAVLEHAAGYTAPSWGHPEGEADVQPTPFIGRVGELAIIGRSLDNARPPVLLFAGEPGIGKSRLLDEAARMGRARGFTVFQGGGHRRSGQEPYAPLLETLARSLTALPSARLRAALAGCGWLARLLPELVEIADAPLPSGTIPAEQERRLIFSAVARYLANVAGPSGTLLLLDDLQWASPDGLDLLTSLLRSGAGVSIRIMGAYRDTEVGPDHALSATLADLAEHDLAEQVLLEPLADQEVIELLDVLLSERGGTARDGSVRQEIVRRAGGLPFFLISYVQSIADAHGQSRSAVPWNVAQSIRQRLATLGYDAQRVLQAAAVTGALVERRVVLGMEIAAEGQVLSGLDAACRARLLVPEGERDYRFAHDVVREAIEADLGTGERTLLHRRVGDALERLPDREGRAAQLAWHFHHGDDAQRALVWTVLAGEQAEAVCAYRDAERHYRTALELAADVGDRTGEAQIWEKLGSVLKTLARYEEALAALERSAALYAKQDRLDGEGRVVARIGWLHTARGTPEEGLARVQPVVEMTASLGPSSSLPELYTSLAEVHDHLGQYAAMLRAAESAIECATALGDIRGLAAANATRGGALVHLLRLEEAARVLQDAAQMAERIGDLPTLYKAQQHMVGVGINSGRYVEALEAGNHLVAIAERMVDPELMSVASASRALARLFMGDWDEAAVDIERALSLARDIGAGDAAAFALRLRGRLCVWRGAWEEAVQALDACIAMSQRSGNWFHLWSAHSHLAERDVMMGHPEKARDRLLPVLAASSSADVLTVADSVRPVLIWAYLEMGDLDRARAMLEPLMDLIEQAGLVSTLGMDLWLYAMIATRTGQWEEAKSALERGLALMASLPHPLREARLLMAYGKLHAARREFDLAREKYASARSIFSRLGATPDIERVAQALAELR